MSKHEHSSEVRTRITRARDSASDENLRVEYQAAQDSAHHHDALTWTVTSIMWGGNLVLMGFVLNALQAEHPLLRPVVTAIGVLGIALAFAVWLFAFQFNVVKRQKYARCREIEDTLRLRQHSSIHWPSGSQRLLYSLLMMLLVATWAVIIWGAWQRAGP